MEEMGWADKINVSEDEYLIFILLSCFSAWKVVQCKSENTQWKSALLSWSLVMVQVKNCSLLPCSAGRLCAQTSCGQINLVSTFGKPGKGAI